jgi:hypothetical protein
MMCAAALRNITAFESVTDAVGTTLRRPTNPVLIDLVCQIIAGNRLTSLTLVFSVPTSNELIDAIVLDPMEALFPLLVYEARRRIQGGEDSGWRMGLGVFDDDHDRLEPGACRSVGDNVNLNEGDMVLASHMRGRSEEEAIDHSWQADSLTLRVCR